MKVKFFVIVMSFLFSSILSFAESENVRNDIIEDLELDTEESAEQIFFFRKNPLNINSANKSELEELPYLSSFLAEKIIHYREKNGPFHSLDELKKRLNIEEDVFSKIMDFITVDGEEMEKKSSGKLIVRLRDEKPMDSYYLTELTNEINKRNYKYFFHRFELNIYQHFHLNIIGESDLGEKGEYPGQWTGGEEVKIYEMVVKNFFIDDIGMVKKLLIGDYRLSFGQGLIFGRGFKLNIVQANLNKDPVKKVEKGIRPLYSINQSRALYGITGEFKFWIFTFFPIYSNKKWDAKIDEKNVASTRLDTMIGNYSDTHVSETELLKKERLQQEVYGGRIRIDTDKNKLNLGATYYYSRFSHLVDPEFSGRDTFYEFRGRTLNVGGIDFNYQYHYFNLYGEFGKSWHLIESLQTNIKVQNSNEDGYGRVIGLLADFRRIKFSSLYYDVDVNFYSPFANVFIDDDRNIQGFFQGLFIKFNMYFNIWGYVKVYRNQWRSYYLPVMSYKQEYKGGFNYKIVKDLNWEWQGTYQEGPQRDNMNQKQRYVLRYQIEWEVTKRLAWRTRYENTHVNFSGNNNQAYGELAYMHFNINPFKRLFLFFRIMHFYTTSSEATVYVYENELEAWPTGVKSYSGNGFRFFIQLREKLNEHFNFETKYGMTQYLNENRKKNPSEHAFQIQTIYYW